jgi:hypothetical protein
MWRMPSSEKLHCVAPCKSDISEERSASATQRNIPEDCILHSHCCENLKSYIGIHVFIKSLNFQLLDPL